MHIDHFTYGIVTPLLSYGLSVVGSLLGLVATARARSMTERARKARWLLLAAWAIGGTGIWVMHFMAMIGFTVSGLPIRYDITITLASWVTAIVTVGIGLFIVGFGKPRVIKILAAGVLTGVGVAAMHYSGMAAMQIPATVTYDQTLVAASVAIAIVASTVALWFTVTLKKGVALGIAALIMGVAVNGMHFTGMFAMRVSAYEPRPVAGVQALTFLAPIIVFVVAVIAVLLVSLLTRSGIDNNDDKGDPTLKIYEPPTAPVTPSQRQRTSAAAFIRPIR